MMGLILQSPAFGKQSAGRRIAEPGLWAFAIFLLAPVVALAEQARPFAAPSTVQTVAPSGIGSLGQVTLSLAIVLAVIFAAAWLLRRVRGFSKG
jgi:hypothetical protein